MPKDITSSFKRERSRKKKLIARIAELEKSLAEKEIALIEADKTNKKLNNSLEVIDKNFSKIIKAEFIKADQNRNEQIQLTVAFPVNAQIYMDMRAYVARFIITDLDDRYDNLRLLNFLHGIIPERRTGSILGWRGTNEVARKLYQIGHYESPQKLEQVVQIVAEALLTKALQQRNEDHERAKFAANGTTGRSVKLGDEYIPRATD